MTHTAASSRIQLSPRKVRCAAALAVLLSPCIPAAASTPQVPVMIEVGERRGLDFRHDPGASGRKLLPEITGSGVALVDLDRDGLLEIYFVQGGRFLGGDGALLPAGQRTERDRVYRQLERPATGPDAAQRPVDGTHSWRDVTSDIGTTGAGYGMGVAIGDVDNDGWPDVFVANLGRNELLRNDGGKLVDVTEKSGLGDDEAWSVSAAFLDYDRDGWLDLFVGNYVEWSPQTVVKCFATSSRRDYCGPAAYPPRPDLLYRNKGDGTFERVRQQELRDTSGPALGVVVGDLDADGWLDLMVANDGAANHLWRMTDDPGSSGFEEIGLFAGVAVNQSGRAEASMGIDLADVDGDGDDDLFLAHLDGETNTLLRNEGGGSFRDVTRSAGFGPTGFRSTAFGTGWVDLDGDNDLDLVVVNGAVRLGEESGEAGAAGLGQVNHVFRNEGNGRLGPWYVWEASGRDPAGESARLDSHLEISRGLALGDLDNDGDVDVVVTNNDGPARVYENYLASARDAPWWGVDLRWKDRGGRSVVGGRVGFDFGDDSSDRVVWRRAARDGSYASSNDPRVVAIGRDGAQLKQIIVRVPGLPETTIPASELKAGQYTVVEVGEE